MPLRTNGAELRRRREELGITLTDFAAQAGYSLNYASQVELGNCNAGPRFLKAAARLLGCEIKDISSGAIARQSRRRRATAETQASA